ncbi:MAG TPA: YfaZ family outer membrane protein [Vicinamibacteria bacterium]|nr:YfaZ family outer membrane protein [Vicinamibacteria bacterium]
MMPTRLAFIGLALLGSAVSAAAQDVNVLPPAERYVLRVEGRGFQPTLAGTVQKGSNAGEGSVVDVVDDLGLQDEQTFDARGIIQYKPGHKLRGSYTRIDYRGDQPVPQTFTYGQTRYERFTRVRTTVKGAYLSADYEWDFVKRDKGYFGIVLGARGFDLDTVVLDVSDSAREADTIRAVIPVAGVATRVYMGRLSLGGEVAGLTIGDKGHIIEVDGGLRFHVSDRLAVGAGYRYLDLEGRDGRDEVTLTLRGWQAGIELSL